MRLPAPPSVGTGAGRQGFRPPAHRAFWLGENSECGLNKKLLMKFAPRASILRPASLKQR